jgi:hypothetical protein
LKTQNHFITIYDVPVAYFFLTFFTKASMYNTAPATTLPQMPQTAAPQTAEPQTAAPQPAAPPNMIVYYRDEHGTGFEIPALHIEVVMDSHGITEEIDHQPVASQTWGFLWSLWNRWFGFGICFCLSPLVLFSNTNTNTEVEEKDDEDIS